MRKLTELGIDWGINKSRISPLPDDLEFKWDAEQISEGMINLKVQTTNIGNEQFNRLIAVTEANNVLLDGLEFPIGKLLPGESISRKFSVKFFSSFFIS